MVLVEPKSAGLVGGKLSWKTLKENKFLELQHFVGGLIGQVVSFFHFISYIL
jgi:hypothetical protein